MSACARPDCPFPLEAHRQFPTDARMAELAARFPSLRCAPGARPWNAGRLDAWAAGPAPSTGALHAARFVLSIYNARATWACGSFSVALAHGTWDAEHRAAFAAWVAEGGWLA